MPVHIDELITEVTTAPEPDVPRGDQAPTPCDDGDRLRAALARLVVDQLRTRAEGFDD